jgi:murein DD-endopeptidase MepM/ murein hydrolase activator NlpD
MLILYRGTLGKGGNVIVGLGPKWRIHYYAHLDDVDRDAGIFLGAGDGIGTVGDTGNAQGKPPHLHYSIVSLLPRPWAIDGATQGYKKAFFINPISYLSSHGIE